MGPPPPPYHIDPKDVFLLLRDSAENRHVERGMEEGCPGATSLQSIPAHFVSGRRMRGVTGADGAVGPF